MSPLAILMLSSAFVYLFGDAKGEKFKFVSAQTLLVLLGLLDVGSAQFLVEVLESTPFSNHRPVVRCDATGANFGEDVMAFSFGLNAIGCAIRTLPEMACEDVVMPRLNETGCTSNFAIVPRGNCSFSKKAYHVQFARPTGYEALIMYNDPGQAPIPMSGSEFADAIQIPIVMVNYACMESLMGHYSAENGYVVTLKASPGYYDLIKYLVPFVAIVGFCFVVLFISLVIRLCRERRRMARKRLSRSNLKKIPTKKYKKGDPEETCAICLDDFAEGDKLRVLACRHAYHTKCVDPWLTKNRKVCPVCKRKVGPSNGSDSSDSDSERATTSSSVTTPQVTREQDPLLRNEQPMATNSSADFPYPQQLHSNVPLSSSGTFSRAASLLNLSNLFHVGRNQLRISRPMPNPIAPNQNNSSREFLVGSIESTSGSRMNVNQEPSFPMANNGEESVANNIENGNPSALRTVKNRFSKFFSSFGSNPAHTLLDEEDASTTVTRDELESDPARQNNCSGWSDNTGFDTHSNSADANSLTTVYSSNANNRQVVSVDIEAPESNEDCQKESQIQPVEAANGPPARLNVVVFDENSPEKTAHHHPDPQI